MSVISPRRERRNMTLREYAEWTARIGHLWATRDVALHRKLIRVSISEARACREKMKEG